jgi:hypothetical protein
MTGGAGAEALADAPLDLDRTLEREVDYQPIVEVVGGRIVAAKPSSVAPPPLASPGAAVGVRPAR